ncbi:MAG: glycerol-3-phosphate dehydrogenase/oxidase [Alphaproteobacteria bacterium]|nr:glycerol-3-phosphate dehydrogenase/oxidase [Alphaproteobacteria bacterium]
MKRDLQRLAADRHDLVVVGAGITGAAIAWDAALRGLRVALIDKDDFAHATTAASSKLIHGGLRYLKTFDIGLVRESLQERRVWQTIAPHLVRPLPFLLPTYGYGQRGWLAVGAGLAVYDFLARGESPADPDQALPRARPLGRSETVAAFPMIDRRGLTGGWLYYDAQMLAPERLALAFVRGAAERGGAVANYVEVERFLGPPERVDGVAVVDRLGGGRFEIQAALTVNATGPWADRLLARRDGVAAHLVRSKGIHLIVPPLHDRLALAMQTASRHFFALPWRSHTILATTDTPFIDEPDRVGTSQTDIDALLATVNAALPGTAFGRGDVRHFYAGLRPLVADKGVGAASTYGQSRKAEICDHASADGVDGLLSVLGGKWTTSRHLAEQVVDRSVGKLGRTPVAAMTARTPLPSVPSGPTGRFIATTQAAYGRLDPAVVDHLVRHHGSDTATILSLGEREGLLDRVLPTQPTIAAEVVHAVRSEMALALDDVLFRRTGLGTLGHPGNAVVAKVAALMANELDWTAADQRGQIERALRRFSVSAA